MIERARKIKQALKLRKEGVSYEKVAEKLGIARCTAIRWINNPEWYSEYHPTRGHRYHQEAIPKDTRDLTKYYEKIINKYKREEGRTEVLLQKLKEALSVVKPSKPFVLISEVAGDPETAVLLFSDAQLGLESLAKETGFYDYNVKIFEKRLRFLFDKTIKIVNLRRTSCPIKHLIIFFLGDNLENEITFAGQPFELEVDVLEQFFIGVELYSQFLIDLTQHFETIETYWTSGNHGRVGKKGEHKWTLNWDYFFAKFIEQKLSLVKQITFHIPKQWWQVATVENWNFLLVHGEDIRRYMRFPWYDTQRFDADWTKLLQSLKKPITYNYLIFGHHHVLMQWDAPYGERICNGAFVGSNIYGLKRLRVSVRPTQLLFFVHKKVGISARYPIRLDMAK